MTNIDLPTISTTALETITGGQAATAKPPVGGSIGALLGRMAGSPPGEHLNASPGRITDSPSTIYAPPPSGPQTQGQ